MSPLASILMLAVSIVALVVAVVAAAAAGVSAVEAVRARRAAAQSAATADAALAVERGRDERDATERRRAQADLISATFTVTHLADLDDPHDVDMGTVTVHNNSALPVRDVVAYVCHRSMKNPPADGAGGPVWSVIRPGQTVERLVARGDISLDQDQGLPPATLVNDDLYQCGVWLTYHDTNGVFWHRDFDQQLIEIC